MRYNIKQGLSLAVVGLLIAMLSSCGGGDDGSSTIPGPGIVGANASPNPVTATVGAPGQTVTITFQTSGGQGSNLNVPLNSLPDSWSLTPDEAGLTAYTCDGNPVTSGNGCILKLVYTPLRPESQKSFDLTYTYNNQALESATGNLNIKYSAVVGNVVVTTVNPTGLINPVMGSSKAVSITFNSNIDSVTNLQVTGLESLPSDWKPSPPSSSYSCASVTASGSGCQLNLTYYPLKPESGEIVLNYSYVNKLGESQHSTVTLPYNVSTNNNVVATYPAAVYGKFGESQAISFSFATDDGLLATNLYIDLKHLSTKYPGWSYSESSYSCATIDNNCQPLILTYAPESSFSLAPNTLSLPYAYDDNAKESKSSDISLFYKATNEYPSDPVIVTNDGNGTITTSVGATKEVKVNFNSPVGVTNLVVDDSLVNLATDNPGWSTTNPSFNCPAVNNASSCQLSLVYKPTNLSQYGVVVLGYNYINARGESQAGTYSISYQPESVNHVILHLESSSLKAIVGGTQTLNYSFTTDDGRPAYNLVMSVDDTPAKLTGNTLNCPLVNGVPSICTNTLSYSPIEESNGSFTINYKYLNNANQAESGSEVVTYTAKSSNKAQLKLITPDGVPLTSSLPIEASVNESVDLGLEFTTYDGSKAKNLTLDTSSLPNTWSLDSDHKTCATVESNPALCSMTLNYHPSQIESNSFNLGYSYTDSDNNTESGVLTVYYRSFVAWTRVGRYEITSSDYSSNMFKTSMSRMIMDNGSPMFLVAFLSNAYKARNLATFKLESSGLVKTDFEAGITMFTPDLAKDKDGDIYRAYNVGGNSGSSNIAVQKLNGESWSYVGESTGVFPPSHLSEPQGFIPSLVFDSHNKLYLNANGWGRWHSLLSVLSYDGNNWNSVGSFTDYNGSLITDISGLAIDSHDNLYAIYDGSGSYAASLFKYNGSFWESMPLPEIKMATNSKGALFFDSNDNLYLAGLYNGHNILLKYNGQSWELIGNQGIMNFTVGYNVQSQVIVDKNNNLYQVINDGGVSVYKYNPVSKLWDNLGARSSIRSRYLVNAISIGLSDDQKTLYISVIVAGTTGPTRQGIDLYSYPINQ